MNPETEGRRLVKRDAWMWVCPICETAQEVGAKKCADCGSNTFVGARRASGAAVRNLADVLARTWPWRTAYRSATWLGNLNQRKP